MYHVWHVYMTCVLCYVCVVCAMIAMHMCVPSPVAATGGNRGCRASLEGAMDFVGEQLGSFPLPSALSFLRKIPGW